MRLMFLAATALAVAPLSAQHLVLAPDGNEARYKVREQLAGVDFPNDAIGTTTAITGQVVFGPNGQVDTTQSRIVVDLRPLKSDKERRDGFIQRRTLETEQFPTATMVVRDFRGLPRPIPANGAIAFSLVGDLTIHGVTKPATWQVTGLARNGEYTGIATTKFTFADFGMTKPRVAVVMSVEDEIVLEYQFKLVPKSR